MSTPFDHSPDRRGCLSLKLDEAAARFGREDVIPLWIADMDFAAPPCVQRAIEARARHPIYGYSYFPESLFQAFMGWAQRRHGWVIDRGTLQMATGVRPSLAPAVEAISAPGEALVIQPPVYQGFREIIERMDRAVVENPLLRVEDRYEMDLSALEDRFREGARGLMLCNPHNPVGRAFSRETLGTLLALTRRYGVSVISDEVHGDVCFSPAHYTPLASLAEPGDRVLTLSSPGKTFNLQAHGLAAWVVLDPAQRAALERSLQRFFCDHADPFAVVAAEAAWRGGDEWLDGLIAYLQGNRDVIVARLRGDLAPLKAAPLEAGTLLWLDARALGLDRAALAAFFAQRCGVGLNAGAMYGPAGEGFMRLNLASPRTTLVRALDRIAAGLSA